MAKLLTNTRIFGTGTVDTRLFVNGNISSHSTNTGALQVLGGIGVSGGAFFGGTVTATNFIGNVSGASGSLAGGTAGQVPYQVSPGLTSFYGPGTLGQILISQGTGAPLYVNTSSFVIGIAANLLGGSANQFAYQTAPHTTAFMSTGSMYVGNAVTATNVRGGLADQFVYQSAPGITAFINTGSMYVGRAVLADAVVGGTGFINTVQQTANSAHYLAFVDSNNTTPTAENVYTSSSFVVNPGTGNVGIGTSNPLAALHISSAGSATLKITADTDDVTEADVVGIELSQDGGITTANVGINSGNHLIIGANSTTAPNIYLSTRSDGTAFAGVSDAKVTVLNNGNVGIGGSPSYKLDVSGVVRAQQGILTSLGYNSYISDRLQFAASTGFTHHQFKQVDPGSGSTRLDLRRYTGTGDGFDSGEMVTFLNNGNVGIGLTNPGRKLHVAGDITINTVYKDFQSYGGTTNNLTRTWDGVLVAGSDNGGSETYTVIETAVPQDSYMMGGFTIDWFENYSSTTAKTSIQLGGYWNAESNGGFIGWEYTSSNPNVVPTIQVGRKTSNGNTVIILSHFSANYPVIVARDLWLGYSSGAESYGTGWAILQTSSLTGYTNLDPVVARTAQPAGSISGTQNYVAKFTSASTIGNSQLFDNGTQVGIGTTDFSYTSSDNTPVLGSNTNNKLFLNGSLQLLGNNDAIVFGRGTATFLKDEELGFGWGGGWYMTDTDWVRVRNNKNVYTTGIIRSDSSVRAPIFYDQDNTGYYTDPASFSALYQLRIYNSFDTATSDVYANMRVIRNGGGYANDGMFIGYQNAGTGITRLFGGGATSGALEKHAGYTYEPGDFRAPIFYDSNDTTYYLDPASGSLLRGRVNFTGGHSSSSIRVYLAAAENGAATGIVTLQQWCSEPGNTWDWGGFGYNVDNNLNEAGNVPVYYFGRPNTSLGQAYMRFASDGNWYFYNTPSGSNTRYTTMQLERTGYLLAPQSARSPIFYDSDNSAYYIDAASTSDLNALKVNAIYLDRAESASRGISWYSSSFTSWAEYMSPAGATGCGPTGNITAPSGTYVTSWALRSFIENASGYGWTFESGTSGGQPSVVAEIRSSDGLARFNGGVYSPIFYDTNNTGYYVDPASTTNINVFVANGAAYFYDWVRTYGQTGLYSQSYNQHFYPQSNGAYWTITSTQAYGGIQVRTAYESTVKGYVGYWDSNGFGELSGGSWWLNDRNGDPASLIIGGYPGLNAYNSVTTRRLMFGGGDSDAYGNYYIGTNLENYGGNYNKLDLRWHTGIRMGAQPNYGGIRFYDSEDLGTQVFAINKDGAYAQANQSMRAPIFYDLDNTSYYIDPTSTTSLRTVGSWRSDSSGWDGEFSGKIQYHSNHWYFQSGNLWLFRNAGGANVVTFDQSGNLTASGFVRAGTNVYTDANYGYGLVGVYTSVRYQGVFAMGDAYKLPADGTSTGNLYGIAWSHPNAGGAAGNLASHGMLILENGGFTGAWGGGRLVTPGDIRGTIYYDYSDTSYYCDPNGTSVLWKPSSATSERWRAPWRALDDGNWRPNITGDSNYWTNTQGWGTNYGTWDNAWKYGFCGLDIWGTSTGHPQGAGYVHAQGINSGLHYATSAGADAYGWQMVGAANATANRYWARGKWGSSTSEWREFAMSNQNVGYTLYANIYYDSNDTSYYCDPNGVSNLSQTFVWGNRSVIRGGSPTLYFRDTDENSAMIHCNSNLLYILRGGVDSESWSTVNGYWPQYWRLTDNYILMGGVTETVSDFRAPIFYDSNNTAYYFDGNNETRMYRTRVGPYAGSVSSGNVTALEIINTSGTGDGNVAAMSYHCGGYYGMHQHLRHDGYFGVGGWSAPTWRWYVYMPSGDMTAAGSVTATAFFYSSDRKLKKDIESVNVNKSLDIIKALNPVHFTWKDSEKFDTGFIAQEVQSVLPEAVEENIKLNGNGPDSDETYLTLKTSAIIAHLTKVVQTQQILIENLSDKLDENNRRISILEKLLEKS